jgi:hypothetical protein
MIEFPPKKCFFCKKDFINPNHNFDLLTQQDSTDKGSHHCCNDDMKIIISVYDNPIDFRIRFSEEKFVCWWDSYYDFAFVEIMHDGNLSDLDLSLSEVITWDLSEVMSKIKTLQLFS